MVVDFLPILIIVSLLAIGQIVLAVYLVGREKRSLSLAKEEKRGLEQVYEDQLRMTADRMEKEFGGVVATAQQELGKFLAKLPEEGNKVQALVHAGYLAFTKRLEEKLTQAEDQARGEIEDYKKMMMERVDEQMMAVFDSVTKKVLGKVLTSSQKVDLIVEALEEAKKEKFI